MKKMAKRDRCLLAIFLYFGVNALRSQRDLLDVRFVISARLPLLLIVP
jgi:hypothetical protein